MTSREFAQTDPLFIKACELAGIPATKRQASKFRGKRNKGKANKARSAASVELVMAGK